MKGCDHQWQSNKRRWPRLKRKNALFVSDGVIFSTNL
jgi:hypothetical protein